MLIIFLIFVLLLPVTIEAQQQVTEQLTTPKQLIPKKLDPKELTVKELTSTKLTPKQLTIDDAVQRALTHRPDLEALRYAVQALRSGANSDLAGYYPTINLSSDISQSIHEKEPDTNNYITVNQQIYSFAGPLQKYQKSKNETEFSELERIKETNKTRLTTEKTFLETWRVQEKEKSIVLLNTSARATFQRQEQKNKLEKLDKDEWLKNVADFASSMAQVDQYKDDVLIAYKKLEFLMGESLVLLPTCNENDKKCSPRAQLIWHYKKKYKFEPLETYYHYALTSRPEVPQGVKRIEIEKWNIRLAQGARLPVISADAQAGCSTNPNDTITYIPTADPEIDVKSQKGAIQPFWQLRVSLEWSLFDGLVQQYKEQQAEADKIKEMLKHEQDILNIKQEVHEKYYSLIKILKKLREQKLKYIHGRNHYKLKKQELELGRISQVDFDSAKTDWQNVRFDWISYNVDVALAECELMYACGYPEIHNNNPTINNPTIT